ncbi:ferrochelatase [Thiofilum flexile]|uniref:ferrochelatase n=1 Tax=Thiofilum flexile TaxID=125627 RepID=UPI0003797C74|nr:ferrochelatase [Thiofilum flexile]
MSRLNNETDFFHGKTEAIGVLLVNLGTPDAPDTPSVRRYLRQFLSDPRVVEIPRLIWYPILYGAILPKRPAVSAEKYQKIWTEQGSPLLSISQQQQQLLQRELDIRFSGAVKVALAMRYGKPSIENALEELRQQGMRRLVVLPLYPQYSSTTSGTTFTAVFKELGRWRWMPELRQINHYHDHENYIKALANSTRDHWDKHNRGQLLLMSFHGIPKRNLTLGDPYFCECHKTARLLAEELNLRPHEYRVTFQSRFGKAEWLQPYTDKTLEALPNEGIKKVTVICPGFAADCLETLEEIQIENQELFIKAGGEQYDYVPALNVREDHIRMLADLVQQHTQGWPEADSHVQSQWQRQADLTRQRAQQLGAKQ